MVDVEEVYVRDLYKKHNREEIFEGFYSVGKKIYHDNGEVVNEGFGLYREELKIFRARIMAVLIDDLPVDNKESNNNNNNNIIRMYSRQTKLL